MTIVNLEFRDSELHFDHDSYRDMAYGHHWQAFAQGDRSTFCNQPACLEDAIWARWTVAHPNVTDAQMLCREHSSEVAKATPSLQAVICARDLHDEFGAVLWEQDVQAEFPTY